MDHPLYLQKKAENWYSLEGFPADCVITALRGNFLPGKPDIVISGINSDANLGSDVIYSGTCAGARQASLYGIPGIAVSLCHKDQHGGDGDSEYGALADFVAANLVMLAGLCTVRFSDGSRKDDAPPGLPYFVNVNGMSGKSYQGVVLAGLSNREYRDSVEIHTDSGGRQYSVFTGGTIVTHGDGTDDYSIVQRGYISLSVLRTEPVSCQGIEQQFVC